MLRMIFTDVGVGVGVDASGVLKACADKSVSPSPGPAYPRRGCHERGIALRRYRGREESGSRL
jgi:hypothetical protein